MRSAGKRATDIERGYMKAETEAEAAAQYAQASVFAARFVVALAGRGGRIING